MPRINYPFVINLDWLQLYCYTHAPLETASVDGFDLVCTDYPTSQFLAKCTIYIYSPSPLGSQKSEWGHILYRPRTRVLPAYACQLKVSNERLYNKTWTTELASLLVGLQLEYRSVSRFDIAADFNRFRGGLDPLKLMTGYLQQRYLKIGINRCVVNIDNMGYTISNQRTDAFKDFSVRTPQPTAITWGSKDYVQTQLYDKSKELRDVKFKPWIFSAWERAGLDVNNVYRLEFRISKGGKDIQLIDSGDFYAISLHELLNIDTLYNHFYTYYSRYFRFVKRDYHIKKQQMRQLELFPARPATSIDYILKHNPDKLTTNRTIKMCANLLEQIKYADNHNLLRVSNNDLSYHIDAITALLRSNFPDFIFASRKNPDKLSYLRRLLDDEIRQYDQHQKETNGLFAVPVGRPISSHPSSDD